MLKVLLNPNERSSGWWWEGIRTTDWQVCTVEIVIFWELRGQYFHTEL